MPTKPQHNQLIPFDEATRQRLCAWDHAHVWHPFTQHTLWNQFEPLIIVAGEREYLIDSAGRRYIDGHSSLWCNLHGHRRPEIDDAIRGQLDLIAHSTQLGLASPPAIELARRLVEISPAGLNKVFYSDNGSTSLEVAGKLAFAYWQHRGQTKRRKFIALREAYHGDTIGAVSLGGIDLFHKVFHPLLFATEFAPSPYCYRCPLSRSPESCGLACADEVGRILEANPGEIAAVVVEPLVQGAGGMITAPPGHLTRIREWCDKHDTLLILDEVATGFGRTGTMFACDHERVQPDVLCVSKGLAAGYMPLAATLTTDTLYNAFLGPIDAGRTFYHGHTYTGNPLGCAAALASLDVFEKDQTFDQLPAKIECMARHLTTLARHPAVGDVRQWGMIAGIELVMDKATRAAYPYGAQVGAQICARARQYGVIVRPLADVVVIMPPLVITLQNLDHLMATVARCIDEVVPNLDPGLSDGLE